METAIILAVLGLVASTAIAFYLLGCLHGRQALLREHGASRTGLRP